MIGARLTSFFGRDLNSKGDERWREPTLGESAPAVRLAASDRAAAMEDAEDEEPAAKPNGSHLAPAGLDTLRSVLHDLMECLRLIDAAVGRQE